MFNFLLKTPFTNSDGTPNWLGCIVILSFVVVVPGLLVGRFTHAWIGFVVSAVVFLVLLAGLIYIASALKGFD